MPRDGAIIFSDLIGKLDVLRGVCESHSPTFREVKATVRGGTDAKLIDWLDAITADCPKKSAHNMNDQCGARCPDLPRVL
jgi:hypothetical protein